MATKPLEIIAIPMEERYRRDAFAIHSAKRGDGADREIPIRFSIKGESEPDEFRPGVSFRFWGRWDIANNFGPTFAYDSFAAVTPHGKTGIVAYLKQARHIGDATAYALWEAFQGDAVRVLREEPKRAAEAVGPRFTPAHAAEASEDMEALKAAEGITIELHDLFSGRGFGKACVRQAIKLWGAEAVNILRRDPHRAMALRGVGFKKADAFYLDLGKPPDKLKRQAYCLSYSGLREAEAEGHVWTPLESAITGLKGTVAGTSVAPEKALSLAVRGKVIRRRDDAQGKTWISDIRRANAEQYVCERVVEAMYESQIGPPMPEWETRTYTVMHKADHTRCARCNRKLTAANVAVLDGRPFGPDCITKVDFGDAAELMPLEHWLAEHATVGHRSVQEIVGATRIVSAVDWPSLDRPEFADLKDHQRSELTEALSGPIGILGGRPGTGKTFTLSRLVKSLIATHGSQSIAVCAPTGKAAVRCRETLVAAGCDGVEPRTIHRMLGVQSSEDGWTFFHDEQNPLPYMFVIVDEGSMAGTGLIKSLLAARGKGTGILIVGDVNQLPPVEFGAPLRDLIAAGLPYGELTEIHRNSGLIVRVCSAICDGKPWEPASKIDLKADDPVNLCLIPASKHHAPAKILQLVEQLRDLSPFDPVWDVQVIVAVNKRSPLGRIEMNRKLQELLNHSPPVKNCPFRLNDKVVQLKNSFLPSAVQKFGKTDWTADMDDKVLVCNGEIGKVSWLSEDGKKIVAEFSMPDRKIMVYRGAKQDDEKDGDEDSGAGCDLDLAYALTCHKMQGSQAPVVIVALDEYPGASGQFGVCDRAWLYTAISRAQLACFMVGQKHVADGICSKRFIWRRKTFMVELIREYAQVAGVNLRAPIEPGLPVAIQESERW